MSGITFPWPEKKQPGVDTPGLPGIIKSKDIPQEVVDNLADKLGKISPAEIRSPWQEPPPATLFGFPIKIVDAAEFEAKHGKQLPVTLLSFPPAQQPGVWVHIIQYNGERRDYYGEAVEIIKGRNNQDQALVRLFTRESEKPQWRRFDLSTLVIEQSL